MRCKNANRPSRRRFLPRTMINANARTPVPSKRSCQSVHFPPTRDMMSKNRFLFTRKPHFLAFRIEPTTTRGKVAFLSTRSSDSSRNLLREQIRVRASTGREKKKENYLMERRARSFEIVSLVIIHIVCQSCAEKTMFQETTFWYEKKVTRTMSLLERDKCEHLSIAKEFSSIDRLRDCVIVYLPTISGKESFDQFER